MTRARWTTALALAGLLLTSPAAAAASWSVARVVPLPSGATGLFQGYLPGLSCPDATDCAAVGMYTDASGNPIGMVVNEVNGTWKAGRALTAPSDAASIPFLTPFSVSCTNAGNCATVGYYQDATGNSEAFVADEVNGTWGAAQTLVLPPDAAGVGQLANLSSVDCTGPGYCSAVGTYVGAANPSGGTLAMVVNEVNGTWEPAQGLTLPGPANVDPNAALNLISCSSPGSCAATGSYIGPDNVHVGLLGVERDGLWSATALTPPPNASPYTLAEVSSLDCPADGSCSAIGTYETADGRAAGFTVDERSGTWRRARMMRMPVARSVNPHVFFYGYGGVSCSSVGNCATGGQYRDATGAYQAFTLTEVKGVWGAAKEVNLPAGASAGANGGVVALACPSNGVCRAGAAYLDSRGHYQAALLSLTNGTWTLSTVSLPGAATQVGVAGGVYALACTGTACTATGSFLSGSSTYQGFVLTGQ